MTPFVLTTQVKRHEDAEHKTHGLEPDQNAMTRSESRCIGRAVDVRGDHTSDVAKCDVHRHSDATLGGAADVVAVPGDTLGYVWVYAARDEEDADVLDGVVLAADEHDEADESADLLARAWQGWSRSDLRYKDETDHEDAASLLPVGDVASTDAEQTCNDVWRDLEQC